MGLLITPWCYFSRTLYS